jgi:AcrR family transcriptional regulator
VSGPRSSPPVTTRRRYAPGEGERLRQDLIDAAIELMARHGDLEAISLRSVAREVGVSATAVYRHFDDHVALLRESVEASWAEFLAVLTAARDAGDDPFAAFRSMGDAYVAFALERPGRYRVLFSNKIDLGDDSPTGTAAFDLLVAAVGDILERTGDDRDPFFVAVQVHTWIHGIVDLCGSHPDMPWPDTAVQLDALAAALRLDGA